MKITLVADIYGEVNNGTAIGVSRLVRKLRERGHNVKIVSPYKDETENTVQLPKRNFGIFNHYVEDTNGVALAKPNDEILRKAIAGSDVVHFLLPFKASQKGVKIARELHIPYTAACHSQAENVTSHFGLINKSYANRYVYKHFYNKLFKYVKFLHCPSQFIKDELTRYGYKNIDMRVISNGVEPSFFHYEIEKPKQYKDKFCILMTGRFAKEKRQEVLIKAINLSKYKDKIQLFFAGSGPQKKYLQKLGDSLANKPVIKFFEEKELKDLINYADLYVHTSDIEIESLACMEAFTCGLVPVISDSKRSATKQFALTPDNTFLAGSSVDLADKIDYFIEHPDIKAELSKKYIEYAKQFAIENSVSKMEQMFNDAIEYYKNYYKNLPDKRIPKYKYPNDPHEHFVEVVHNKNHKIVDENFTFVNHKPVYVFGSWMLRQVAKLVIPVWCKCKTHYKINGKNNLKKVKGKGVVIISNHVHMLDGATICARLFPTNKVYFPTLSSNVDIPVASALMRALGAIPIADTLSGMKKFNNTINDLIQKKKPVLIFPEAALWPYYRGVRPFFKGAFTFAKKHNVPILPIIITFQTRKNGKQRMIFNILEPVYPSGESAEELSNIAEKLCMSFSDEFYQMYGK